MDLNTLRTLVTLAAFGTFLGIVWWAYSPARKGRFESDAKLVFDESEGAGQ
ncbi:MAG: CcoQ/FixQ family Cbb3-type cytochrome c oxidase assembly chaperone [Betaproteobacteria bacterium]